MDLRLLGPVEVLIDGSRRPLGGPRQRAVLADLALHAGRPVPTARLVDDLWGESAPASATHTVQAYVSELRRVLTVPGEPGMLLTTGSGYRLDVDPARVDALLFARLASQGRAALEHDDLAGAEDLLAGALRLWRGPALDDIGAAVFAPAAAHRLDTDRLAALETLVDARLRLGRHLEVVSELERLTAEHPFRERFHAQLMTALYRSGRQADALAAYQRARRLLVARRGLEPGPELRALEQAILTQSAGMAPEIPAGSGDPLAPPPARLPDAEPAGSVELAEATPRRAGAPLRRVRGRAWTAIAAAVIVLAAVALPRFVATPPAHAEVAPVGVSEVTGRDAVAASLPLPGEPGGAASGDGSLWVSSPEAHALYRIDPATDARLATIGVGAGAGAVAVSGSDVWVANALAGTLSRVDARTNTVVQTVAVGPQPTGLAIGDGTVWVADASASTLSAVVAATGRVTASDPLSTPPFGVAFGAGSVWLTSPADDEVTRFAPGGGPGVQISVGSGPTAVAFGLGSVWVTNSLDSTVSRIDPATDAVTATIPVGDGPDALAVAGNTVWVGNRLAASLTKVSPTTDGVTTSVTLGASPVALATVAGGIWAATRPTATGRPSGGNLRVLSNLAPPSIDPALSWPVLPVQFTQGTYDTLVTFERVGGSGGLQLVPDLALTMPTVTADGTVYSFTLRPGLRYSDGSPVRPADFRYALERVLELNPTAASFMTGIDGAAACRGGHSCDLDRGITISNSADSVTFHLTAVDPAFLDKLAFGFTAPVPASIPAHDVGEHPVPGTGPYRITRYLPGTEVDFTRNPRFREWSAAAQPAGSPDRITWIFGESIPREVTDIGAGRADWTVDLVPDPVALRNRFPRQVHLDPVPGNYHATFNTRVAPFDDVRVRRAFSLAADRRELVTALGGPDAASPTCQILPTGIPGYQPYCPFTIDPGPSGKWVGPDLPAARKLVAESGTAGMRVTVWAQQDDQDETVGAFMVAVLRELGYRASMVAPAHGVWAAAVYDSRRNIQATDGLWTADYPSASEFVDPFFRCSAFRLADPADTTNRSFFCDPTIDRLADTAEQEQAADPAAAAATWTAVDRDITDAAPWVTLATPTLTDFLSTRVSNYQYNPAFGVVLDQLEIRP